MPLDAMSTIVATYAATARGRAAGGQIFVFARSVKYAANSPPKNMSSDASHTTVPTPSRDGRRGRAASGDALRHAAMMAHRYARRGERRRAARRVPGPGSRRGRRCSATGRSTRSSCSPCSPGVLYAVGVRRLAARGRRWPPAGRWPSRPASSLIVLATQSGLAQYDRVLFSLHVVAAPAARDGRAAVPRTRRARDARPAGQPPYHADATLRVLHSRPVDVVTHPLVVWVLFGGTLVVLYFTGLYELSLRNNWVHMLLHVHFVVVGCLFMAYVIGVDPLPRPLRATARGCSSCVVVCRSTPSSASRLLGRRTVLAGDWYAQVARPWMHGALSDQRLGAGMLWTFGELFGLVAVGIVLYQWMRHEELAAARADRQLDADHAATDLPRATTRA